MTEYMRRGEAIERRLRALAARRVAWDAIALGVFTAAMFWAMLVLVAGLFWSGWVMAALLVPV